MIFDKNVNKRLLLLILVFLFATLSVILYFWGDRGLQGVINEKDDLAKVETVITEADRDTELKGATKINLSETKGTVLIDNSGDYLISGELDGSICIEVEEQIVHLCLSDITIRSPEGSAIRVNSAGKVIFTILEGTENYLYDSGEYDGTEEEDACIYSVCDVTFNGGGALEIYGYYKDAIHSKDKVKVINSNIFLKAKREGLRANDGIYFENAQIDIECMNDGLRTTNSGEVGRGNIEIRDSIISIIAGRYGINSASNYFINGSEENIRGVVSDCYVKGETYTIEETVKDE